MHIDLTPEQEARISALATSNGKNLRDVITETAVWLLQMDAANDAALTPASPRPIAVSLLRKKRWTAASPG